jgi:N6-L-threonylcarbamoyladenine synthase
VAANSRLRALLSESAGPGLRIFIAPPALCTDNAAMIASSAYFKLKYGRPSSMDGNGLSIQPQLHIPFLSKKVPTFQI